MSREGLVSFLVTSMVIFDLCLLGFSGCVERKYDEENYPVVMETGSDVVDNQDVYEEEDTTHETEDSGEEKEDAEVEIEDGGDPMDQEDLDQFTDVDEDETEGMDIETAELVEDIQTMIDTMVEDADSINLDKSCEGRCGKYTKGKPCQCDTACFKASDCCEDLATFCPEVKKPEDKDTSPVADTAQPPQDTYKPPQDTWQPPQDTNKPEDTKPQLGPGECPKDCKTWYNGCNTCQCNNGKIGGCTKMGCPTKKEPYCKKLHGT